MAFVAWYPPPPKECGDLPKNSGSFHKVRHPRCVYNKLDWSLYTCLTQLYGGIDMSKLLHKELHVSALYQPEDGQ